MRDTKLNRTEDIATEAEIREMLYDDDEELPTAEVIQTHDGDWRRETGDTYGTVWRFWEIEDL